NCSRSFSWPSNRMRTSLRGSTHKGVSFLPEEDFGDAGFTWKGVFENESEFYRRHSWKSNLIELAADGSGRGPRLIGDFQPSIVFPFLDSERFRRANTPA